MDKPAVSPAHTDLADAAILALFREAPWPLVLLNTEQRVAQVNPATARLCGEAAAEMIGRPLVEVAGVDALPEPGMPVVGHVRHTDGRSIGVQVSVAEVALPDGTALRFAALCDWAMAVELSDERLHMAELTGILRTIATVNHQINNPLFGLVATLQLLRDELGPDTSASLVRKLDRMAECCDRIKAITDQLGQVVRPARQTYIANEDMLDLSRAVDPGAATRLIPSTRPVGPRHADEGVPH